MATKLVHKYAPYGTAKEFLVAKDSEILYCGAAGTGKSRACLEKIHIVAMKYPGARILMVRKNFSRLADSVVRTYENHVATQHIESGEVAFFGGSPREAASFRYKNGSAIVLGGMDKSLKIMSTEYDIVYVNEANELTENDWESLTTRLRNGKVPYQQLIADCNPDTPTHWLKVRCDKGKTRYIASRHEDNPVFFNQLTGEMTIKGKNYIEGILDNLDSLRKERYRYGRWVAADGLVYDNFDPSIHIHKEIKEPPKNWDRYLSIDFGYNDPFVCQFWAVNDGIMYLYKEVFRTQVLLEDHAKLILDLLKNEPRPKKIITDHAAQERKILEKYLKMPVTLANKKINEGIQATSSRLIVRDNGKPKLYLCQNAVVHRDNYLEESKKPCSTLEEITGYVWNKEKDIPIDANNHGMDAMRYMVSHLDLSSNARADRTLG